MLVPNLEPRPSIFDEKNFFFFFFVILCIVSFNNFVSAQYADSGCAATAIQLGANGGNKYEWSPPNGLSNATIANPVATLQNSQSYTVLVTETSCNEEASFTVPVTIKVLPPVIVTKSNDISCNTPFAQINIITLALLTHGRLPVAFQIQQFLTL